MMVYRFPPDVEKLVHEQMKKGHYSSEDDVLRDALKRLARDQNDVAAIQAGIEDMEAGRFRSLEQFDTEFRANNGRGVRFVVHGFQHSVSRF